MSLNGKNIIITGATSGIGVEMAAVLSNQGASVFIGGRRADRGQEVAEKTKTTFHTINVADEASNKEFFKAAEQHFGGKGVDFILLNAGVEGNGEKTQATSLDVNSYDEIFSVNVRGIVLGLKYGTPLLRKGGTFLFTSSAASIMAFGGNPIYAASKATVDALVRSYAAQFAESEDERLQSLSVLSVNPTLYATDMADRFTGGNNEMFATVVNPSQRVGQANELAYIVLQLVQGDLPYKTGESFVADADTHFPLDEYFSRMKSATTAIA